jgi:hypothetical protein
VAENSGYNKLNNASTRAENNSLICRALWLKNLPIGDRFGWGEFRKKNIMAEKKTHQ